jgi:hypothetical protein
MRARRWAATGIGAAGCVLLFLVLRARGPSSPQPALPGEDGGDETTKTTDASAEVHAEDGGNQMTTTTDAGEMIRASNARRISSILAKYDRTRSERFVSLPPDRPIVEMPGMLDGIHELADIPALPDAARVEGESKVWAERFFRTEASPWRRFSRRDHSYHLAVAKTETPDVLLHAYKHGRLDLRVYEAANSMLVSVEDGASDLPSLDAPKQHERIREIAGEILKMEGTRQNYGRLPLPYRWDLQFEGLTFSSDPSVDLDWWRMEGWWRRIDGGIANGKLYFLLYKQRPDTTGRRVVLDEEHWFDGKAWEGQRHRFPPTWTPPKL